METVFLGKNLHKSYFFEYSPDGVKEWVEINGERYVVCDRVRDGFDINYFGFKLMSYGVVVDVAPDDEKKEFKKTNPELADKMACPYGRIPSGRAALGSYLFSCARH